jgi:hypothetical protein
MDETSFSSLDDIVVVEQRTSSFCDMSAHTHHHWILPCITRHSGSSFTAICRALAVIQIHASAPRTCAVLPCILKSGTHGCTWATPTHPALPEWVPAGVESRKGPSGYDSSFRIPFLKPFSKFRYYLLVSCNRVGLRCLHQSGRSYIGQVGGKHKVFFQDQGSTAFAVFTLKLAFKGVVSLQRGCETVHTMKVRLSWIFLGGLLLASWYLGWFAPFKAVFWLARWGWQALSVLQRSDPKPDDNSMIAALRNATGSDFNQVGRSQGWAPVPLRSSRPLTVLMQTYFKII